MPAASEKGARDVTDQPYFFDYGVNINRTGAGAWPLDGSVVTTRTADGLWKQENFGFGSVVNRKSVYRFSVSLTVWGDWLDKSNLALLNNWVVIAGKLNPRYKKDLEGLVHVEGVLSSTDSGITTMFNLPVGCRPILNIRYPVISDAGVIGVIQLGSDGNVLFISGTNTEINMSFSFIADQ